jgi:tetratricopeptide (TPR) repeat protein
MPKRSPRRKPLADELVDSAFMTVLACPTRRPAVHLPKRLGTLFRNLVAAPSGEEADTIEEMIWAMWISHPEPSAASDMSAALDALMMGASDLAGAMLDKLVARYPDWPEAWNKRAVVAFVERRDKDCLNDIIRTLALEPRHFGAIAGVGQICLRNGRVREACAAFEIALGIDPHLSGVRDLLSDLREVQEPAH